MTPNPARRRAYVLSLLPGLAIALLLLLAIIHIHQALSHPGIVALDRSIQQTIHARATPTLTRFARTLSFLGAPATIYPAIALAAAILWHRRLRREATLLLVVMLGASLLDNVLKFHYRRPRPTVPWALVHEHGFSFPSGHSVFAAALYGTVTWLAMRHRSHPGSRALLAAFSLAMTLGIGLSRIYLGAHFPSDVATGLFVGATWLLVVIAADWSLRQPDQYRRPPG